MSLTELFSTEAVKAISYLKDLSYLILSPRKFFESVAEEPTDETIHRLIIYALGFAVFEVALMTTVVRQTDVGAHAVLAVALLEIVLSLIFLPVFLAVSYFLRIHQPVKISLSYALSARFLFLIPTMVADAFFLMTENYAFALVRGVLVYLFLLVHVILFPLALSRTIARRLFSTLLAIFVLAIISVGIGLLVFQFSTETSKWEQLSLLYDPIGAEVDQLNLKFDSDVDNRLTHEVDVIRDVGHRALGKASETIKKALGDIESGNLKQLSVPPDHEAVVQSELKRILAERPHEAWTNSRVNLRSTWMNERTSLQEKRAKAKFDTTRHFIDLRLKELDAAEGTAQAVDEFLATPTWSGVEQVYDKYSELQEATLESLKRDNEYLSIRNWLLRLWLLN